MIGKLSFLFLFSTILLSSCLYDTKDDSIANYIHISHTRTSQDTNFCKQIESFHLEKYDVRLLGGDLMELTSKDNQTINRANDCFNLTEPNTLWSLGNHDYSNLNLIENTTNRNGYYAYYKNGISFIILDTEQDSCSILGDQLKFFELVADTISKSEIILLLHHKLIWMVDHPSLKINANRISNANIDTCWYCLKSNNFYSDIYPKLIALNEKGKKVICVGGDLGLKTSRFEYQTKDGIWFLASGLDLDNKGSIILFKHDLTTNKFNWKFSNR